jgi:hypothetical protein
MILIWGIPTDRPTVSVLNALKKAKAETIFLDQTKFSSVKLKLTINKSIEGEVCIGRNKFNIADIKAAYIRPYEQQQILKRSGISLGSHSWKHALTVEDALTSWVEIAPSLVVNRFTAAASNTSKPYQCQIIRKFGFKTPNSLITTDKYAAELFRKKHGKVICKSLSSIRSIVFLWDKKHGRKIERIKNCPTQFQEFVDGTNYRVHVIGDKVFASEIISKAVDYRYAERDGKTLQIRPCILPQTVAKKCIILAKGLGLHLAGIDLKRTKANEWYCFEVNPSPGFTYYDSNENISKAIADFLITS